MTRLPAPRPHRSLAAVRRVPPQIAASRLQRLIARLFCALALVVCLWQGGLVEVFESHDLSAECEDDHGSCDCEPNCHCCVTCAHQGAPTLLPAESPVLVRLLEERELAEAMSSDAWLPADRGPPAKVPKLLS